MAEEDDSWDKFMASIGDTEEVETDGGDPAEDETKGDDDTKKGDPDKPSEAGKDDDPKPDDPDDPDKKDDPEETGKDDDPEAGKDPDKTGVEVGEFKPRLEQFVNKDGSYNLAGIEKSYIENSKETVRLNTDLKEAQKRNADFLAAVAKDPEIAKKLFGEEGAKKLAEGKNPDNQTPVDPTMVHIRAQLEKRSKKEYEDFIEAHPEAATDPEKAKKLDSFLKLYGRQYMEENNGEFPSMKDGLEAAYRYYDWDTKINKDEKVATAAKKTAATRSTPNKKAPAPKAKKNELEGFFADKLGVNVQ